MKNPLDVAALYERVKDMFFRKDLDWQDIADTIDNAESDAERIGILLRWIDTQSYDEEWKVELGAETVGKFI